ncbi:nucleotide sugar dehydrogenase [Hydrocarboniclastica marina]|uniref:GDP-mannose 6-dehydrogenase n=1 Tax=Hydrocarboniclastica marina TaxID=2259620 RepID=A0A4P7XG99_9ALTE|nr:UDP-glucose/GDP-mannose dehydrogenase family protein [Hydrocarboniclastica marina]QCF26011.1 UDP-glucose/GDP-mannose dehydrogenase family protein [Hydrocarboniclastica marina]
MDISIFGLGYVGAVCCACLAKNGHNVIGVDVSPYKVDLINQGKSPIVEAGLGELISEGVATSRLRATTEAREAVFNSDASFVCVGTPSKANGSLGTQYLVQVCEDIGYALRDKDAYHLVVIRSTVLPGTVTDIVLPILENTSGKKAGKDFGLAMNPEFLRESTAIEDFYEPEITVIGEYDQRSGDVLASIYAGLDGPLIRKPIEVAEMIKYTCNAWHATKVSFANEIGSLSKKLNVDGREVMDVICQDKKLNISAYYLKPGFAFGGSCLPKDLRALTYLSRSLDLKLPLLDSIISSNQTHIESGFNIIAESGRRKVGFLGISFKAGTDDLRESPMVELVEKLYGKGYDIKIYDKNVDYSRVHGANKAYIETKIPHVSRMLVSDLAAVVDTSDILVVGNASDEFRTVIDNLCQTKKVVDLVGFMQQKSCEAKLGICW